MSEFGIYTDSCQYYLKIKYNNGSCQFYLKIQGGPKVGIQYIDAD